MNDGTITIERVVRDAIIGYQFDFQIAPDEETERDLKSRAECGNKWLIANGYAPEEVCFEKGEISNL